MTKAQLDKYIGRNVTVEFVDGDTASGVLGFIPEFLDQYGLQKPGRYTIDIYCFSPSYVKKITER